MSSFNPCGEILIYDPIEELVKTLDGSLHEGSFWTRAEHCNANRYDLHFTVLTVESDVGQSKLLIHDGNFSGRIMTLRQFEHAQWNERFEAVSYWPVMQDELHRVRFSPPR